MNKLIGWSLIALSVLVIIGMFVSNNNLWMIINVLEIVVCGWAGYVLVK